MNHQPDECLSKHDCVILNGISKRTLYIVARQLGALCGDNNGWLWVRDENNEVVTWEVRTNGKKYRVECKKIGHYACDSFTELDAVLNKIKRSCGFKIKNAAQQEK